MSHLPGHHDTYYNILFFHSKYFIGYNVYVYIYYASICRIHYTSTFSITCISLEIRTFETILCLDIQQLFSRQTLRYRWTDSTYLFLAPIQYRRVSVSQFRRLVRRPRIDSAFHSGTRRRSFCIYAAPCQRAVQFLTLTAGSTVPATSPSPFFILYGYDARTDGFHFITVVFSHLFSGTQPNIAYPPPLHPRTAYLIPGYNTVRGSFVRNAAGPGPIPKDNTRGGVK